MTTTDQQHTTTVDPTPAPLTWHERCDAAKAEFLRHSDAANEALHVLIATINGTVDDDVHQQLFVGDIATGDQVLWQDGWWFVTGAIHGDTARREYLADSVLLLTRVGYDHPLDLRFTGNTLLTVVRCAR